jgi:hypothetical protein
VCLAPLFIDYSSTYAWLPLSFIVFISLVIADHFLTYEGVVKNEYQERMLFTKQFMEKYGPQKGLKLRTLMLAGFGTLILMFFSAMECFRPGIHLAGVTILAILTIYFLAVVILNVIQLLKR